jgi:BA14K-like protein
MASRPGQAATVLFYFSVVLVAASSVAFGLDWMKAPLPPMPETEASVQAAKLAAHVPPPRQVVIAKKLPRSVYPTRDEPQPGQAGTAVAAVDATKQPGAGEAGAPNIMTPEPGAQAQPAQQPQCDIAACTAAYRSFRASDCTWQPFDGPRRFCDKGNPPQQQAALEQADNAQYSNKCDIEACKRAYLTFDPTDCTYKPTLYGPRELCTKGTPPPQQATTAPATPPTAEEQAKQAAAAPASTKCDIQACTQAYRTFNPADCTYKPTLYGPRALCTKGTPPQPEAATAPATPPAADEQAKQQPPAPADQQAKPEAAAPVSDKCDVTACKQAYFTFNPADCTYQPSEGPRELCTKGTPPKPEAKAAPATPTPPAVEQAKQEPVAPATEQANQAPSAPGADAAKQETPAPAVQQTKTEPAAPSDEQAKQETPSAADQQAAPETPAAPAEQQVKPEAVVAPTVSDKCDIEACKRAFHTFNPADCTYKPTLYGPRELCTKGTPPKPEANPEPATLPAADEQAKQEPAAPVDAQAKPETAASVSDKCNVAACKQAYFSFNPADCTYQPSEGPRRLCTKGTPPKPEAKAAPAPRAGPSHPVPPAPVPAGR